MTQPLAVILASIITALGGIVLLYLKTYLENRVLKAENAELKTSVTIEFEKVNLIQNVVFEMFKKTKSNRFVLFMATNNAADMRFTTAFFEQHKDGTTSISFGATNRFIKFQFDSEYRKMLKKVEIEDSLILDTITMPECDLKNIYLGESIKHSIVHFLRRMPIDAKNDKLIYASISTQNPKPYDPIEIVAIKSGMNQIKEISKSFL